mmetsp:Transcript_9727/g.44300  ORF Transcript_9727/g.44300 Transcript_9727/m.44300 type:complete len:216 (+) Transcript_9727:1850-2497(+)
MGTSDPTARYRARRAWRIKARVSHRLDMRTASDRHSWSSARRSPARRWLSRFSKPPSTGRARATHPWRTCSAGSGTPETTARYLAGRAIWARASRTVRASVSRGIRDGGARTNATAPGSSYFPNLTRPTPTRTLITCRWCQVTPITTRAACLTCTSSTGFRRHLRTIRGRIARADTGETRFPTKLNRYRLTSCRSMPKTVKGTPGRSATFRVIRA